MDELIEKCGEILRAYWGRLDETKQDEHHERRLALNHLKAEFEHHAIDRHVLDEFKYRLPLRG